jgi:hypothetical protein
VECADLPVNNPSFVVDEQTSAMRRQREEKKDKVVTLANVFVMYLLLLNYTKVVCLFNSKKISSCFIINFS